MAIISAFPGKSKPKLQEKNVAAELFYSSNSTWDVYTEVKPDTGYDGLSKVGVERIYLRAMKTASFDYVEGSSVVSIPPVFSDDFKKLDASNVIGVYLKANAPENLTNDNALVDGLFYCCRSKSDASQLLGRRIYENKKDGSWTPNPGWGPSFSCNISNTEIKLSNVAITLSSTTRYSATIIYNRIKMTNL